MDAVDSPDVQEMFAMLIELCLASVLEAAPQSWDHLPAFVRGVNRGAGTPPPAYMALRRSAQQQRVETAVIEEDAERWDGLS